MLTPAGSNGTSNSAAATTDNTRPGPFTGSASAITMRQVLAITRALGDETRLRALMSLVDGELCVCQIIQLLDLAPSTVSKHMSILHQAGLVERRKDGRWQHYRLADVDATETPAAVRDALNFVRTHLAGDAAIRQDAGRLCGLRAQDPAELTDCYTRNRCC